MRVPRYDEPQVGIPSVPSVRVQGNTSPQAFGAGIGEALQRAGEKLAYVAVKQQEEADRSTFALLSAKANAFAEEVYANEQNNPDYEGMNERFKEAWKGYKEKEIEALPDRLREKASQMFDISGMSYDGKFKGLFVQKQNDSIKAGYAQTINTLVKSGDIEGLKREVPNMRLLSKQEQEGLIRKNVKAIQLDMIEKVIDENPDAEIDKSVFDELDQGDWNKVNDWKKAGKRQQEVEQNKQDAELFDNIYGQVRSKSMNYKQSLKVIDSTGLSEREKWQLKDLAEDVWEIGKGVKGDGRIKTDDDTYWALQDMVLNKTLFEEFPTWETFYKQFKGSLGKTELKQFFGYYKKQGKDDDVEPVVKFSRSSEANNLMSSLKIEDRAERLGFIKNLNETVTIAEKTKRSLTGQGLTDEEYLDVLAEFGKKDTLERKAMTSKSVFGRDIKISKWKIPPDAEKRQDKEGNDIYVVFRNGQWQEWMPEDNKPKGTGRD